MHKNSISIIVFTALILLGCGFHLRGVLPIPPEYQNMYLQSKTPFGTFERQLRRSLTASDVKFTEEVAAADMTIDIINNQYTRKVSKRGGDTRVQEFRLTQNILFKLIDKHGNIILPETQISEFETFTFDRDLVVGKAEEERLIKTDLARELATKMIYQISGAIESTTGHNEATAP